AEGGKVVFVAWKSPQEPEINQGRGASIKVVHARRQPGQNRVSGLDAILAVGVCYFAVSFNAYPYLQVAPAGNVTSRASGIWVQVTFSLEPSISTEVTANEDPSCEVPSA